VGLGHDLPISRPGTAAQIDELVASKDVGSLCPYYLDLASAGQRLTAVVERIKALGGVLHVAACKVRCGAHTCTGTGDDASMAVQQGVTTPTISNLNRRCALLIM
jgi:hypothetical protein